MIQVVKNLNLGGLFHEEKGRASCEWLYITGMFWEQGQDIFCQPSFSTYPGDNTVHYAPLH